MNRLRRARPWLGTLVEIAAAADLEAAALLAAIDAADAAIAAVHGAMSVHDPASELSRLNAGAHLAAVPASAALLSVLRAALDFAEASDGAFDPVVGGRLTALGLLPDSAVRAAPDACWRDVGIDAQGRVRFAKPLRLDFGGIAKGYAVDCAIAVLRDAGVASAQVNAGGDLRVFGAAAQTIALRDPRAPTRFAQRVALRDQALATSAPYHTTAAGTPSALIEPRSGDPYAGGDSISVIAPSALVADALTKVALFATSERLDALLERHDAQLLVQSVSAGRTHAIHA